MRPTVHLSTNSVWKRCRDGHLDPGVVALELEVGSINSTRGGRLGGGASAWCLGGEVCMNWVGRCPRSEEAGSTKTF
eukprot:scaffold143056_cov31-Tisochrysis_lutea.AAC.1